MQPPPFANVAPADTHTNVDPHGDVRRTPAAQLQKSDFFEPNGAIVDTCGGRPCHTYEYTR